MDDLIDMLETCKLQFEHYAELHRSKGTDDGRQKAITNMALADKIREVLQRHNGSRDLSTVTQVPDYRFATVMKGERYLFARGLTINPTHLPGALDAMERDGWNLLAIFGQSDAQNIGFIFQRKAPSHKEVELTVRVDELISANNELVFKNRNLLQQIANQLDDGK